MRRDGSTRFAQIEGCFVSGRPAGTPAATGFAVDGRVAFPRYTASNISPAQGTQGLERGVRVLSGGANVHLQIEKGRYP